MKQILSLALVLALTAALLTGCGCAANVSDHPGGMITEEPTTRPTVMPSPTATHATEPKETTLPAMTDATTAESAPGDEGSMPTTAARRPRNTAR